MTLRTHLDGGPLLLAAWIWRIWIYSYTTPMHPHCHDLAHLDGGPLLLGQPQALAGEPSLVQLTDLLQYAGRGTGTATKGLSSELDLRMCEPHCFTGTEPIPLPTSMPLRPRSFSRKGSVGPPGCGNGDGVVVGQW